MANVGLGDSDSATTNEGFVVMSKAEAEIQYATGQCKGVLCNGKCRCDNEETHTIVSYRPCSSDMSESECFKIQNSPDREQMKVFSRCVNSQCVLSYGNLPSPPLTPVQQKKAKKPSSEVGTGQR